MRSLVRLSTFRLVPGTPVLDFLVVGRVFSHHRRATARATFVKARCARMVGGLLPALGADAKTAGAEATFASSASAFAAHSTARTASAAATGSLARLHSLLLSLTSSFFRHLSLPRDERPSRRLNRCDIHRRRTAHDRGRSRAMEPRFSCQQLFLSKFSSVRAWPSRRLFAKAGPIPFGTKVALVGAGTTPRPSPRWVEHGGCECHFMSTDVRPAGDHSNASSTCPATRQCSAHTAGERPAASWESRCFASKGTAGM